MLKHISTIFVLIFISILFFYGCDTPGQTENGSGSGDYDYRSDQVEFKLPAASDNAIASYQVDLKDPVTREILGSQEGVPGETLIFDLDRPKVYLRAILTAVDANGAEIDTAEVVLVDVDVANPICQVTVDTAAVVDSDNTKVDVSVECFGVKFADVHVDPDE